MKQDGTGVKQEKRVGLWLIGAGGRVGSAVALGVAAIRRGKADTTGLVSELPVFGHEALVDPGALVLGGHEISATTILDGVKEANRDAGLFSEDLIRLATPDLRRFERNVRPGTLLGISRTVADIAKGGRGKKDRSVASAIARLRGDLVSFRKRHKFDHVVVVNLGSSEASIRRIAAHRRWSALSKAIAGKSQTILPASSIYALAAIDAGCAFIDFTPSTGLRLPALRERAEVLEACFAGSDGKTGETLVKSVLAPMFAMRNLDVLSWTGHNLLGNRDGEVLRDPKAKASKIVGKDAVVRSIVGESTETHVSIDYVRSLDDWKVAWDYIHFSGFLGTKMAMQFTWQGCDSMLAAPLVIDLARFASLEMRRGASGPMKHLSFFFKNPIDVTSHDLSTQFRHLVSHITGYES